MEVQGTQSSQNNLQKNTGKDLTLADLKTYSKATVIKKVWYWPKGRGIDQWNRTDSGGINPCTYGT